MKAIYLTKRAGGLEGGGELQHDVAGELKKVQYYSYLTNSVCMKRERIFVHYT